MKAIRIPGLDIVRTGDPDEICTIAADPRMDRHYEGRGPFINRFILRRIRRVLQFNGMPLPPVAPKDFPGRAEALQALERSLESRDSVADQQAIDALASYVRGTGSERRLGIDAQQAVGSLFASDYQATRRSWGAARVLAGSVQGFASPMPFLWRITGRLGRSRDLLASMVGGDLAGVHATGVAIHNLVESLRRMRLLARTPGALGRYAPEEAASLCLSAPANVVREATSAGSNGIASFRRGTLVLLQLEDARERTLRPDMAFMRGTWSQCPAHRWVPALLAAVWRRSAASKP